MMYRLVSCIPDAPEIDAGATGQKNLKKAWRMFVKPGEKIGLKVNPVAGKLLLQAMP